MSNRPQIYVVLKASNDSKHHFKADMNLKKHKLCLLQVFQPNNYSNRYPLQDRHLLANTKINSEEAPATKDVQVFINPYIQPHQINKIPDPYQFPHPNSLKLKYCADSVHSTPKSLK